MPQTFKNEDLDKHLDRLVDTIEGGHVVPVVGNNILTFKHPNGSRTLPLSDLLAVKIASEKDKKFQNIETIDQLYHKYSSPGNFYRDLKEQLNIEFTPDNISFELYDLIAQIKSFKLIFNASYTNFLENHIRRYQHNKPVSSRKLYQKGLSQAQDIEIEQGFAKYVDLKGTYIYNLFGYYNSNLPYIVTEDDYIDFIFRLGNASLPLLRNVLRDKEISYFFIGCSFPNWLFRFFIRALLGVDSLREIKSRELYVSDANIAEEDPIMVFFKNYEITYLRGVTNEQFIRELYARLQHKYPNEVNSKLTSCMVFISYHSDDFEIANDIRNQLMNDEKIDPWFDDNEINDGDSIQPKLKEAIDNSSVFIPIISKNSDGGASTRHYRREWEYALRRHNDKDLIVIPIKIDDLENDSFGIPSGIWDIRRGEYANGRILDKTIQRIRDIQRVCRKNI